LLNDTQHLSAWQMSICIHNIVYAKGGCMAYFLKIVLGLITGLMLINTAFAAERIVVCEELYSETWSSCRYASGTLAQIAMNYPGRVALVEMHIVNGYPLYSSEARSRMGYYPGTAGPGSYWTPWLWYDGRKGSYSYGTWQNKITTRMAQPAPVTVIYPLKEAVQ